MSLKKLELKLSYSIIQGLETALDQTESWGGGSTMLSRQAKVKSAG